MTTLSVVLQESCLREQGQVNVVELDAKPVESNIVGIPFVSPVVHGESIHEVGQRHRSFSAL